MLKIIESVTAGSTLLLSFLIFVNPRGVNKVANRWLGAFVFCIFIVMIDSVFERGGILNKFPHLIGIATFALVLIPPTFFLAIKNFVSPNIVFRKKDCFHFTLFVLFFILDLPFLMMSADEKVKSLELDTGTSIANYVIIAIIQLHLLVYWIFSFLKLNHHQKNIKLIVSNDENLDLQWLKYFVVLFLVMFLVWASTLFIINNLLDIITNLLYCIVIFSLGYFALKQEEIYSFSLKEKEEVQVIIDQEEDAQVEKKKMLNDEELSKIKQQLAQLMETQKSYLENDLSLPKLAIKMNISAHAISYALNEGYGENFSQFINRHRVNEAKRLLISEDKLSLNMLGIAFESGFNSKTAFNTAFKKITGVSPSDFKNQNITSKSTFLKTNL